ncbi:MAG: hypothetical protein KME28_09755 [Pelatocladus maniniholoensis HA4357-MV3]|jgi:hypothetical protein|uniref:Uncharacterized protein n=1 Tax=Pelatocladus maniniholoensis HA4357-MV3 TaxID=1117104 RepID=A0A9E3H738_9NOST|nr:hypothetical protein [Pelatocladus maniniholoensis HA4357-MV3]BAZ69084.1 hypothetical protein NIES4106_38530 [Fischerella sp. NIES-4106]
MPFLKRLPWLSLTLLLLTYIVFGWLLARSKTQPILWLVFAIATVFFIASLTIPFSKVSDYSISLFRSNLRSFGVTVFGAFLFFLILARFRLFLDILVIIAASMLVRIDFQAAGFNQGQVFWITTTFSLIGLALGALVEKLMSQYGLIL